MKYIWYLLKKYFFYFILILEDLQLKGTATLTISMCYQKELYEP